MAIPDSIGVSFAPTREASELAPQRARSEGLQEAIRVLSLHVPNVLGGRPVAAGELLRASGGGDPVSAVVESVLRSVMGGQAAVGPTVGAAARPGAVPAIGAPPAATDSAAIAQAAQALARPGVPRIIPGFRPGFGETGFLRQAPGESAFEAIQRHTRPETRQAQLAGPIARSLTEQERFAEEIPEGLPRFRERLGEIEALAKLPSGFLGPISQPTPQKTFADVLSEAAQALADMMAEERRPVPAIRASGRPMSF